MRRIFSLTLNTCASGLDDAKKEHEQIIEQAQLEKDEVGKHSDAVAEREKALTAREDSVSKRERAAVDREGHIESRHHILTTLEKHLADKKDEHDAREAKIQSLEKSTAANAAKAEADAKAAVELRQDLEHRVAKVKEIAG